jgi:hypothetical protein
MISKYIDLGLFTLLQIDIEYLTYDVIEIVPTCMIYRAITFIVDENFAFQRKPKKTSHSQRLSARKEVSTECKL